MALGDRYMSGLVPLGANKHMVRAHVMSPPQASSLLSGLHVDAGDYYYSAWITFLDALNGISRGFYTWGSVKAYYSVFYALRAALAEDGVCAFYIGHTQYTVEAKVGSSPISSTESGTHKTVLKAFQVRNPSHLLISQKIDVDEAIDWMMHRREYANYAQSRFGEPECCTEFDYLSQHGLRRTLNAYLNDTKLMYAFDPDHAIIAYPLCVLRAVGGALSMSGRLTISDEERVFLRNSVRDERGSLPVLLDELKRLKLLS
jgi:hypothetical protein